MPTQQRTPTGDGVLSEWDPPTNDYLEVDDPIGAPDDATTFISSSTVGADDLFVFGAFTVPAGSAEITIVVRWRARITGAGSGAIRPSLRVNGTVYYGTSQSLTTSWVDYSASWSTNPGTGVPWTVDEANSVSAAVELQEFGVEVGSAVTATLQCTQAYAEATYAEAAAATGGMHPGGEVTVLASAARTASVNSADQRNYNASGLALTIDVTAITATPSVTFAVKYKDSLSGKYVTLLTSAAITAVGTTVLRIGPWLTAAANLVARDVLPVVWRVEATHGDADSITYSASANYTFGGI